MKQELSCQLYLYAYELYDEIFNKNYINNKNNIQNILC